MRIRRLHFMLFLLLAAGGVQAQRADSARWIHRSRIVRSLMGTITHDVGDPPTLNVRSEDAYMPYEGKVIRKILFSRIGFESTVIDSTQRFRSLVARAANAAHTDTREFAIHNNLFVREGQPLDPYRVADNERTLRTLTFIMDARILVKPVANSDSVDLVVVTRDVFSLGGSFEPDLPGRYKFSIDNTNVAGMGQRVRFGGLVDDRRTPRFGYDAFYQKTNVMGSFIDAAVGYSQINTGPSLGSENERAYYLRLNRNLFHPLARWAGGAEFSANESVNVFLKPDTSFAHYRYSVQDYWAGYSFGHGRHAGAIRQDRSRNFVAVRGYQQFFTHTPDILLRGPDRYRYRTRVAVLGQLSFFRQDYYKTQYVIGFGRTEDIPYGYRLSFTAGWEKELDFQRPYAGAELYYSKVRPNGSILTFTGKLATYQYNNDLEDGLLSLNLKRFSQLFPIGNMKTRHQWEVGYAALYRQHLKPGLDIRDQNGIIAFRPDSLAGTRRFTLSEEVVLFTQWKVLGFHLAPLMRVDLAMINHALPLVKTDNVYAGISTGLRARNENLIFNTVEARVFWFPRTVERMQPVTFQFSTNLLIRYPTNLVSRPGTVFN